MCTVWRSRWSYHPSWKVTMPNFVFILQNWMYLYGCSNHNPDPLKEKIGSKDSKARSLQMQRKKVDALTLVRQHTANINLSNQQIRNWAIKEMRRDFISIEMIYWIFLRWKSWIFNRITKTKLKSEMPVNLTPHGDICKINLGAGSREP